MTVYLFFLNVYILNTSVFNLHSCKMRNLVKDAFLPIQLGVFIYVFCLNNSKFLLFLSSNFVLFPKKLSRDLYTYA
jgi:hypothetical protein